MRRLALCMAAAVASFANVARADAPATPPAPPPDAWSATIRQGMRDEGAKTRDENAKDREEARRRAAARLFLGGGLGFGLVDKVYGDVSLKSIKGPVFGVAGGVRLGLNVLWQFQARAALELSPASASGCSSAFAVATSCDGPLLVVPSADATFRVHLNPSSPLYFGFGPRLGMIMAHTTASTTTTTSSGVRTTTAQSSTETAALFALLAELGALFGPEERYEVGVRPYFGMQTSQNPKIATGGSFVASYAF